MKLLAINIGGPQTIEWEGKKVETSIFKTAQNKPFKVFKLGVEGDHQSDKKYHGGANKAVYAYDESAYEIWRKKINREEWTTGMFGENFTTIGLSDASIKLGNLYTIGTCEIRAVEPRIPCFKLNIRFQQEDVFLQFYQSNLYGTYFSVEKEGIVNPNDKIELKEEAKTNLTIQDVSTLWSTKGANQELLVESLNNPFMTEHLKNNFRKFLKK